jgi:hypothetical protein
MTPGMRERLRHATPGTFSLELRQRIDAAIERSKGQPFYTTEQVRAARPSRAETEP